MAQAPEAVKAKILKRKSSKAAAKLAPARPKPVVVADDKSNANRARSEKYQATPAYRKTLRDVYDTKSVRHIHRTTNVPVVDAVGMGGLHLQPRTITLGVKTKRPLAERQSIIRSLEAKGKLRALAAGKSVKATPVEMSVLKLHGDRQNRAAELRSSQHQHDVTTDADRKRVAEYIQTADYKHALSDAAFAGAKARGRNDRLAGEDASAAFDKGSQEAAKAKQALTAGLGPTALDKAIAPVRHKIASTALWTADQVSRPLYAVSNTSNEGLKALRGRKHDNLLHAAGAGAALKKKTLFSDVLKTAGAPKWLQATGGLVGDVAFDPLTYATLGTGVPAEIAARTAYKAALASAERKGVEKVAAERGALAAAKKVYEGHAVKSHGLTVGARAPLLYRAGKKVLTGKSARREVVARGKLTGGTARAVGAGKSTGKLLTTPLPASVKAKAAELGDRAARDLIHDYRPKHIDPVTWNYIRDSTRDYRAARAKADRLGSDRAVTYTKALKGIGEDRRVAIRDALEADDLSTLSGKEHTIAQSIQQDLHAQYSGLVDAGILKHSDDAKGYFPRYMREEVFHLKNGVNAPGGTQRIGGNFVRGRKLRKRLAEMDPDQAAKYDLRIPEAVGRHLQDTTRAMATKDLHDRMASLGEQVTGKDLTEAMKIRKGKVAKMGDDSLRARLATLEHDKNARLMFHDGRGYRLLQNSKGELDHVALKKARKAIKGNKPVLLLDNSVKGEFDALAERGIAGRHDGAHVFTRGFDRTQGQLKTLQTVVNPGYHITNLIGDSYNAHLGGATLNDFRRGKQLKKVERKMDLSYKKLVHEPGDVPAGKTERYGEHDLTDQQLVGEAIQHGAIKTGYGGHELRGLVAHEDATKRSVMGGIRDLNERREDLTRLATYYSARKRGMTPGEAANWVNKHHFDYSDLTDAERTVLRRFIPFYTFMSRNTRAQVRGVLTRPGVYANTEAARQETTRASGMDPEFAKTLRPFEQAGVPWGIKLGGEHTMLFPKLPLTDLNNLNPSPGAMWQNLVGRGSPLLKVAIEQTFKKNTFTKSDFQSRVPAPAVFKDRHIRDAFNHIVETVTGHKAAITDYADPTSGKVVPGWSWRFDELLRQVPASSQFVNATVPSRAGRQEDAKYALAGYALGPRPQPYNAGVVKLNQLWEKKDKLQSEHDDLVTRVATHKSGSKWHGKIGHLNKEITKTQRDIYKQAKALGSKNPPGLPPKKGRKKSYGLGGSLGSDMGGGLGGSSLGG